MAELKDQPTVDRNVVLLTHPLPDWVIGEIREEFDLRLLQPGCEICKHARAMITPGNAPVGAAMLDELTEIGFISSVGSGYEGIDTAYTQRRGITVAHAANVTGEDVADHTVGIILALYCRIPMLDRAVRADQWPKPSFRRSFRELNVGVVGLGAIGRAVVHRLATFGCDIRWTGPRFRETAYTYVSSVTELASWSDILIVTARADASNVKLIDRDLLDRIGPEGMLVNVSRGSIVDEDALIAALNAGTLGGAALDVFETEPTSGQRWRDVPNAVLTPHVGGLASSVQRAIRELLRSNLRAFFNGLSPTATVAARRI